MNKSSIEADKKFKFISNIIANINVLSKYYEEKNLLGYLGYCDKQMNIDILI